MTSTLNSRKLWHPNNILNLDNITQINYAVIILNREISLNPNFVKSIWESATVRILVDGGANRWLEFLHTNFKDEIIKNPDYITGDFDSISSEALNYWTNSNCQQIHTPNQNETDFTKSLLFLNDLNHEKKIDTVIVLQETSGRLDHIMANINTLCKANDFLKNVQIFLLSSKSLSWILTAGRHSIIIPDSFVEKKTWCGLIPIGNPCVLTTTGLKWNLNNSRTEFGQLISTSNTYDNCNVEIDTDGFILWTMGIFRCEDD